MLLMGENWIRGDICHGIHRDAKANIKYMKDYDKNSESTYLMYLDENNFYGWVMVLWRVNGFKWKKTSKFNKDFIKTTRKTAIKDD